MRKLGNIIKELIEVAPELEGKFDFIIDSMKYTAPELMYERWCEAAEVLGENCVGHAKEEELSKIFSGSEDVGMSDAS